MSQMTTFLSRGIGRVAERTADWATRLLVFLLVGDVLFIIGHILVVATPWLNSSNFYLDVDGGYGEWFQYLKFGGAIGLLIVLWRRERAPLYLFGMALFTYLLLDDSLRIHEVGGLWLAEAADLPPMIALRPQDIGEMAISGLAGLFLLTLLFFTYQPSHTAVRRFTQGILVGLVALVFFGVVADMVQVMVLRLFRPSSLVREFMVIFEDGGELMVASGMVWWVYQRTEQVAGWTAAQVQEWVREAAVAVALMAVLTAALATVQAGTAGLAGNDGYYHAKMGLLLRQGGLEAARPHLPLTVLGDEQFYNHHLLYHAYLALFARTDPATDGGVALTEQVKRATIIMAVLPFMAIWWLLRGQGVRWPALWTLALLALSEPFLYRLSMPRAQAASLLVLVVGLHWLLRGRYRWLAPLGASYVWLYDAFPLLLVVAGVYFAAVALAERRWVWPALIYPAVGIAFGLIINPYFPENIPFISHHLLAKLWEDTAVAVGNEWYPYETWSLIQHSGLAIALFLLTLFLHNGRNQRLDARLLTLMGLAMLFGLLLFRSRRFIEYFPAFVLLWAAVALSPLLAQWAAERRTAWVKVGLALCLALPIAYTVRAAQTAVADSPPADQYASAALWLKAYSEPQSMIFQTDWDDFTRLFFYNSDAQYTIGLDPTFMARQDEMLFARWVQLTRGEVGRPSTMIREQFQATYVFSDLEHEAFERQAVEDPLLHEVYRDEYAVIFEIRPPTEE